MTKENKRLAISIIFIFLIISSIIVYFVFQKDDFDQRGISTKISTLPKRTFLQAICEENCTIAKANIKLDQKNISLVIEYQNEKTSIKFNDKEINYDSNNNPLNNIQNIDSLEIYDNKYLIIYTNQNNEYTINIFDKNGYIGQYKSSMCAEFSFDNVFIVNGTLYLDLLFSFEQRFNENLHPNYNLILNKLGKTETEINNFETGSASILVSGSIKMDSFINFLKNDEEDYYLPYTLINVYPDCKTEWKDTKLPQ